MRRWRSILIVILMAATAVLAPPYFSVARAEEPPAYSLSPYWKPVVSQWEDVISRYAQERGMDPDFVAAVIWKESRGIPTEHSIVGAVGLMQLMPRPDRPSPKELEDPWTNVMWGTKTMRQIIRDGNGDLYYALAAYNGGWNQIHLRVTRRYATEVLDSYSRAIAMRHGLPADGNWVAIFAVEGVPNDTITVMGPQRLLTRYTERPWIQANIPAVPDGVPPHATVITFVNGQGIQGQVNLWLVAEDGRPFTSSAEQSEPLSPFTVNTTPAEQGLIFVLHPSGETE